MKRILLLTILIGSIVNQLDENINCVFEETSLGFDLRFLQGGLWSRRLVFGTVQHVLIGPPQFDANNELLTDNEYKENTAIGEEDEVWLVLMAGSDDLVGLKYLRKCTVNQSRTRVYIRIKNYNFEKGSGIEVCDNKLLALKNKKITVMGCNRDDDINGKLVIRLNHKFYKKGYIYIFDNTNTAQKKLFEYFYYMAFRMRGGSESFTDYNNPVDCILTTRCKDWRTQDRLPEMSIQDYETYNKLYCQEGENYTCWEQFGFIPYFFDQSALPAASCCPLEDYTRHDPPFPQPPL